ncbi:neprilysin-4-like [Musca vetustissima]|uniref:neprilysin-4-like n=1 Tax=Musca vetustissima TaxID=27455 RepID=UPI002AB76842|nr:neprilysin-4-like [Musca vetustissima]
MLIRLSVLLPLLLCVWQIHSSPVQNKNEAAERKTKAEELLKYMNKTVDPCDDFYDYVCGNYATYNPATLGEPGTGLLETLQSKLDAKIKTILNTDDKDDSDADRKVKSYYRSCLQITDLAEKYPAKLQEIIKEFGEMPALVGDKWQEAEFDWLEVVGKIAYKYGFGILMQLEFSTDFVNNTVNRLYISEQDFDLPRELYVGPNADVLFERLPPAYAGRLTEFLGIAEDVALTTATEFLQFERSIAKAMFDQHAGDKLSETYVLRTLDEAQEKFASQFDIKHYVKLAVGTLPSLKIYTDDDYMDNLLEVLKTTPKKVLANYIFYRLSNAFIMDIPETKNELEDTCLTRMKKYFHKNFDNMVYRKYNSLETEQGVQEMFTHIKAAFHKQLQSPHLNWLSEETRQYALEKLKKMQVEIVSFKDTNFSEILGPLEFDSEDYLGNLKKMLSSYAIYDRSNIGDTPRQNDYGEQLSTTPAYIYVENTIKVPVAMLQPNYAWSAAFPNAFNFGVLGALLSHELIHGFDGDGRTYDALGNNRKWWDSNSDRQFKKRSECLIHQYKDFIYAGQHLSEMPNQDENIADNSGVRLAYNAYLYWYDNSKEMERNLESFPGMDEFNYRQLFFTSYGYLWCSDFYSKLRSTMMAIDIHVPDKFRVLGPLSNFAEFSKEFNCPVGSKMNPEKKCEIY